MLKELVQVIALKLMYYQMRSQPVEEKKPTLEALAGFKSAAEETQFDENREYFY